MDDLATYQYAIGAIIVVVAALLIFSKKKHKKIIPLWPPVSHAPTPEEQRVIDLAWGAMGGLSRFPVWIYRNVWDKGPDGLSFGDLGRKSEARKESTGKYGPDFLAYALLQRGRINVLMMTPGAVVEHNRRYSERMTAQVPVTLFSPKHLGDVCIHERLHLMIRSHDDERFKRLEREYKSNFRRLMEAS